MKNKENKYTVKIYFCNASQISTCTKLIKIRMIVLCYLKKNGIYYYKKFRKIALYLLVDSVCNI